MAKLITCLALTSFSQFVSGHGIIHGDPESPLKAATHPEIPEHKVETFVDNGWVEAPEGFFDGEPVEDGEPTPAKKLADMTKAELLAVAAAEDVTVAGNAAKADIVAAINAARAEKAAADQPPA